MKKSFVLVLTALMLFSCEKEEIVESLPSIKVTEAVAQEVKNPESFYVLNEDWFGHDEGTLNYFKKNGNLYDISYRVYRAANPGEKFGTTSCYGTFWGENLYVVSKDAPHLVVADAETLKKKFSYTSSEKGVQAYSFVGVNEKKAYIGFDNGVSVFDIASMTVGQQIEGISEAAGNMASSMGKVFILGRSNLYVVNAETDKVESKLSGVFYHLTVDKHGNVIVATDKQLVRLDPVTLNQEPIAYPEGVAIANPWGFAWNTGSLCASINHDYIYWVAKNVVYRTDLNTKQSESIYTLGQSEAGKALSFYGGALRVDPLTDELILLVKHSGWGDSGLFNFIYKLDADGKEICHFDVLDENGEKYYWFPSLPVFADANMPQILLNTIEMDQKAGVEIDLQKVIVDYDNTFASMIVSAVSSDKAVASVSIEDGKLVVAAGETKGTTQCEMTVVSNGVKVSKTIEIVNK